VRQPQHQRGIGAGARRDPFWRELLGDVLAQRRDVDEMAAPGLGLAQPVADHMTALPAGLNLRVLQRHAAEGDEEIAMLGDQRQRGRAVLHAVVAVADDVRHDHRGRRQTSRC